LTSSSTRPLTQREIEILLSDRVEFKLYAAKYHLEQLKEIDQKYGNILHDRVNAEMQIDCFFAQLIAAKDSLLVKISEKKNLGLSIDKVDLCSINDKLNKIYGNHEIVRELNKACSITGWLWSVNQLRNHSLHRGHMLSKHVWQKIIEDLNKGTTESPKPQVYFMNPTDNYKTPMNKPVVEYLEDSLRRMKGLIHRVSNNYMI
jgi:hypothetical protein